MRRTKEIIVSMEIKGEVYFTSDGHFAHDRIIEYCGRPFSDVNHMNESLIANWNEVVSPEDTVFHLGDTCMGQAEEWHKYIKRLNGYKILVLGNHDRKAEFMVNAGFQEAHSELYVNIEGINIWMHHYPITDVPDKRGYIRPAPSQSFDVALCGHVHNAWVSNKKCVNVGADVWEYRPQSLATIVNAYKEDCI